MRANGEKVLEQEQPVRLLPDGSMGPGDLRVQSWVTGATTELL